MTSDEFFESKTPAVGNADPFNEPAFNQDAQLVTPPADGIHVQASVAGDSSVADVPELNALDGSVPAALLLVE